MTAGGQPFSSYGGVPDPDQTWTALDLARLLLEAGVDPDPQLNMHRPGRGGNSGRFVDPLLTTGATPLLRAATARDTAMVELLLSRGAAVDLPNVKGFTPLMAAAGLGNGGNAQRDVPLGGVDTATRAIRTIDLLVAAGADVNARAVDPGTRTSRTPRPGPVVDRAGQSPLFGAVIWGKEAVISHLIAKGANVGQKDDAGRLPADLAKQFDGGRDPDKVASLVAALVQR
jgi:ankyrin repeat protein